MTSRIDHLVVTARSLQAGVDYVRDALGVAPLPGGEHERMGTHNCLLRLGEAVYLEVIAANPAAPAPGRARWFGLDRPPLEPRLATWIARTDDIRRAPAALGTAEPMSRGSLRWLLTVPQGGRMPMSGLAPGLIEWRSPHPARALPDLGCSLIRLEGFHPDAQELRDLLKDLGLQDEIALDAGEPALVAHVQTPSGTRKLA